MSHTDLLSLMVMVVLWVNYREIPRLFYLDTLLIFQRNMVEEVNLQTDLPTSEMKRDSSILRESLKK
jgi:hypothetical protein